MQETKQDTGNDLRYFVCRSLLLKMLFMYIYMVVDFFFLNLTKIVFTFLDMNNSN